MKQYEIRCTETQTRKADDCVYCNEVDGNEIINDEELIKFIEDYA